MGTVISHRKSPFPQQQTDALWWEVLFYQCYEIICWFCWQQKGKELRVPPITCLSAYEQSVTTHTHTHTHLLRCSGIYFEGRISQTASRWLEVLTRHFNDKLQVQNQTSLCFYLIFLLKTDISKVRSWIESLQKDIRVSQLQEKGTLVTPTIVTLCVADCDSLFYS